MPLIHSERGFKPRIFAEGGTAVTSEQINRAQSLIPTGTLNYLTIKELGRDGKVASILTSKEITKRLDQHEEGEISLYRILANEPNANKLELPDFADALFGISAYLKDDKNNFKGTIWYPGQRISGFSIDIGDPQAIVGRSFDFIGEDINVLQGSNKYLIDLYKVVESGEEGDLDIVIGAGDYVNYPYPVEDPNNAGIYILRVVRVRGTEVDILKTGWSYVDGTKTITIEDTEINDVYKIFYSASSYITSAEYWEDEDNVLPAVTAKQVTLLIGVGDELFRIQSARLDTAFTREDVREIGNEDVIARGISDKTVTITLGKILEKRTLEEVMAGQGADWGIITPDIFSNEITFYILVYKNEKKLDADFKIGYKAATLAPTGWNPGEGAIATYVRGGVTLLGDSLVIANNKTDLGL